MPGAESLAGVLRPLIAGLSGSAAGLLLSDYQPGQEAVDSLLHRGLASQAPSEPVEE